MTLPQPLRVLVIDDEENDAQLVARELRKCGHEIAWRRVDTAADLVHALEERWDVVLSDWSMPAFSGLEALRIVRERAGDVPFVLVSGAIGEERAVEAMRLGADDVVLKDRLARLVPAVEREIREAHARAELRGAEDRLRRSEEALVRNEKLRALGEMAAGVSHDLRNLLNPLSLQVQVASRACERGATADAHEALREIRQLLARGVQTVERLRDYGRQKPDAAREALDLNALASEAIDVARPRLSTVRNGLAIVPALDAPPPIPGVPGDIVSALVNLLVNAIDAMREKGSKVTLETGRAEGGAYAVVADDGPGMPHAIEERAFEPFFTTKGAEGTGLGLAMVYACMQRHGGNVSLETAEGVGTRVRLWFPARA